jgi:hypothetical protein
MRHWFYEYQDMVNLEQFPDGTIGFIYKIVNDVTGKFYIGKKSLQSTRTKALTKKELAALTDKRMSKKKTVVTESDWKTYMGSNAELKKDITLYGSDNFSRGILHLCSDKTSLTYHEARIQFFHGVLESDNSYNDNILGKFYRRK